MSRLMYVGINAIKKLLSDHLLIIYDSGGGVAKLLCPIKFWCKIMLHCIMLRWENNVLIENNFLAENNLRDVAILSNGGAL